MLFALLNKNKVIGLFNDYDMCTNMLNGLVLNNFVKENEMNILAYEDNSIKLVKPVDICYSNTEESLSEDETTLSENSCEKPMKKEVKKLTKEERDKRERNYIRNNKREYNLQLLKNKKERLEEQQRMFKIDINLYQKFKKIKESDESFEIPDIFDKKYIIMEELDKKKCLNCDIFFQVFEKETHTHKWSTLFTGNAKDRDLLEVSSDED
jgi:hypothetical protein